MRNARAGDHWRRLCETPERRAVRLISLEFSDVLGLGEGHIELHPGLTIVCGANGVGKSTLLTICGLTLEYDRSDEPIRKRYQDSRVSFSVSGSALQSVQQTVVVSAGQFQLPPDFQLSIYRLDPSAEWFRIRRVVQRDADWEDMLQSHESKELSKKDLEQLSYLSGKDYKSCVIYEIDDYGEGEKVFPYCRVVADGDEYGFEEMGAGEGALFIAWWFIRNIKAPGILLLEEPESHITSHSQRHLMNIVAEYCTKQISCIVTTHSSHIITHVPRECLRLVFRQAGSFEVVSEPDDGKLEMALGIPVRKRLLILVEDRCARIVARLLLRMFGPELSSQIAVSDAGSNAAVISVLKNFPDQTDLPKLLGVLDGDQRSEFPAMSDDHLLLPNGFRHPLEFLPGEGSPEEFLQHAAKESANQLAATLRLDKSDVRTALASVEGKDPHEWLELLQQHLEIDMSHLVAGIMHIAAKSRAFEKKCREFVRRVSLCCKD